MLLVLLVVAPLTVVLILFLTALLGRERADIPAIMEALAAVPKALTRRGDGWASSGAESRPTAPVSLIRSLIQVRSQASAEPR